MIEFLAQMPTDTKIFLSVAEILVDQMGHERPPIRCRALVRTTLRWPIDPGKKECRFIEV